MGLPRTHFVSALAVASLLAAARPSAAQERGAGALGELVAGLGTSARVLVIGAHPDDEDTQLITWLARGRHVETAYLSLTRGDGGQNLIGNELGPALGVIRTEELLAARRIDGGRQYFTRAFDFGFSKNAEETLQHWPKDSILKDMVAVVRAFRPHAIIAIWSGTRRDGHGHHELAGILAREVFDAAADTVKWPVRETGGLGAWATAKLYRGAYTIDRDKATLRFNVGEYSPLAGRSYSEIASESRSQHASQGQGGLQQKGVRMDYLRLDASRVGAVSPELREKTMFDGVDTTWARFREVGLSAAARAALDSLPRAFEAARQAIDLVAPESMVPKLARVVRLLQALRAGAPCQGAELGVTEAPSPGLCGGLAGDLASTLVTEGDRAERALLGAAGVAVDALAPRAVDAVGDSIPVSVEVYARGRVPIDVGTVVVDGTDPRSDLKALAMADGPDVRPDSVWRATLWVSLSAPTRPWWLERPRVGDVFQLARRGQSVAPEMVAGEDRLVGPRARVGVRIGDVTARARVPIEFRSVDPARGERRRPVAAAPAIAVSLEREVEYARAGVAIDRTMRVTLRSAAAADQEATVSLDLPRGLTATPATAKVTLAAQQSAAVDFRVRGTLAVGHYTVAAVAEAAGKRYDVGYTPIEYEHIRPRRLYRPATTAIEAVDVKIPSALAVAYVRGVGDNVAPMLEQLGVSVQAIDPAAFARTDLSRFTTIVIGPRAFEASEALVAAKGRIDDFVSRGHTAVVQYGQFEMARPGLLPFAITLSRPADRVTEENAAVTVLDPRSPLLAQPNRIDDRDFAGWVQERGLYMPRTFDQSWKPLLSMHDSGEPPLESGILVANVGRGTYVYTTLSFFRQLPAGNPGAARLFLNLLAADQRAVSAARPVAAPAPRP